MKLERYLAMGKKRFDFEARVKNNVVDMIDLFKQLDEKMGELKEREKADLSYSFVKTIMDSLTEIAISHAQNKGIEYIGLTGGVSYNIPITEMVSEKVEKAGLELLVHNRVPNGDGGISVGQNAIVGHGH
jgi:hydrogenase maturation protein HypF